MIEKAKELKTAIAILSKLHVSGDAVDLMAAAKHKIRNVIADLEKPVEDQAESK